MYVFQILEGIQNSLRPKTGGDYDNSSAIGKQNLVPDKISE
jgi:hypothetical protein